LRIERYSPRVLKQERNSFSYYGGVVKLGTGGLEAKKAGSQKCLAHYKGQVGAGVVEYNLGCNDHELNLTNNVLLMGCPALAELLVAEAG
jgi:hypothetical protein